MEATGNIIKERVATENTRSSKEKMLQKKNAQLQELLNKLDPKQIKEFFGSNVSK
jgi:DNA-binding MurR/RpiR family transcriptional regulator